MSRLLLHRTSLFIASPQREELLLRFLHGLLTSFTIAVLALGSMGAVRGSSPEKDPIVGAVSGIVQADGAGNISAASDGTDYLSQTTGVKLDQTTPQTMTGLADGFLKLTTGVLGTGTVDLSGYVPYTGATGSVDLGTHGLTAAQVTLKDSSAKTAVLSRSPTANTFSLTNEVSKDAYSIETIGNGTNYVKSQANLSLTGNVTFSHSFWVKYAGASIVASYGDISGVASSYNIGVGILTERGAPANRVVWGQYTPGVYNWAYGSTTLSPGTWYHIVFVWENTGTAMPDAIVYVNGVLETMSTGEENYKTFALPEAPLYAASSVSYGEFDCLLDDFLFYGRALTAGEAAALYAGGVPPTDGLLVYWKFDNDLLDSSGNGKTGVVVGSVPFSADVPAALPTPTEAVDVVTSDNTTATFGDSSRPTKVTGSAITIGSASGIAKLTSGVLGIASEGTDYLVPSGGTLTGVWDAGGTTSFEITNSNNPTVDAAGEIAIDTDTDNTNITHGSVIFHDGASVRYVPSVDTIPSTDGHVLKYDGTNKKYVFGVAGGSVADVQTWTSAGSYTWTKPAGVTYVYVVIRGAGGGGGGGTSGGAGTNRGGGSGGGGGGVSQFIFPASALSSSETVVVGAGGTGGAAASNGNVGALSRFGTRLYAYGGGAGYQGSTSSSSGGGGGNNAGSGGAGATSASVGGEPGSGVIASDKMFGTLAGRSTAGGDGAYTEYGGAGGGGGIPSSGTSKRGGSSMFASGGGGGGGRLSSVDLPANGGAGGGAGPLYYQYGGGASGGGLGGSHGQNGNASSLIVGAPGGGGGGANDAGVGGKGGNGGAGGGGGGGGGCGSTTGGAGGNGGDGAVYVYSW